MSHASPQPLPPGQQLVAGGKWPLVGERASSPIKGPWQIAIHGEVQSPGLFDLSHLQSCTQRDQTVDIHCVTRWSKLGARFRGVPLADLIHRSSPTAAARFVSFTAHSDRAHSTSLPLKDALELEALVALEFEGAPLAAEHGGPVRLIVPGRYFYKSLKWLAQIELLPADRLGYWESTSGYHNAADPWQEQRYLAGNLSRAQARVLLKSKNLRGQNLLGLQASGVDLAGLEARDALLRDADFRGCDLSGACFEGANLSNAHFQGAQLREASFRGADLEGANFEQADLRGADLHAASLIAASFIGATSETAAIMDQTTSMDDSILDQLTPSQQAFVRGVLLNSRGPL